MRYKVVNSDELTDGSCLLARRYLPRITEGRLCVPHRAAWRNYCLRTGNIREVEFLPRGGKVVELGTSQLRGYVRLLGMDWWWKASELKVVL